MLHHFANRLHFNKCFECHLIEYLQSLQSKFKNIKFRHYFFSTSTLLLQILFILYNIISLASYKALERVIVHALLVTLYYSFLVAYFKIFPFIEKKIANCDNF